MATCPVKVYTLVSNETENVLSAMGASVTVVELRAQPPEGVVVLPAGLLSLKQHGVWEHHAL